MAAQAAQGAPAATGKAAPKGGAGAAKGKLTPPEPAFDFEMLMGAIAGQGAAGAFTPRTVGMSVEEANKEWGKVSEALNRQMDTYLKSGEKANFQKQQTFDNALKLEELQLRKASEARQGAMLDLQRQMMSLQIQGLKEELGPLGTKMRRLQLEEKKAQGLIDLNKSRANLNDWKATPIGQLPGNVQAALGHATVLAERAGVDPSIIGMMQQDAKFAQYLATELKFTMADISKPLDEQKRAAMMKKVLEYKPSVGITPMSQSSQDAREAAIITALMAPVRTE